MLLLAIRVQTFPLMLKNGYTLYCSKQQPTMFGAVQHGSSRLSWLLLLTSDD